MARKKANRARVLTATTGTGTVTLGAAAEEGLTFAQAGVSNGDTVAYLIQEGDDFELGVGTYTASGTTLSRDSVTVSKIAGVVGTTKMNLGGAAVISIVITAGDFDADEIIDDLGLTITDVPDTIVVQQAWFGHLYVTADIVGDPSGRAWELAIDGNVIKRVEDACAFGLAWWEVVEFLGADPLGDYDADAWDPAALNGATYPITIREVHPSGIAVGAWSTAWTTTATLSEDFIEFTIGLLGYSQILAHVLTTETAPAYSPASDRTELTMRILIERVAHLKGLEPWQVGVFFHGDENSGAVGDWWDDGDPGTSLDDWTTAATAAGVDITDIIFDLGGVDSLAITADETSYLEYFLALSDMFTYLRDDYGLTNVRVWIQAFPDFGTIADKGIHDCQLALAKNDPYTFIGSPPPPYTTAELVSVHYDATTYRRAARNLGSAIGIQSGLDEIINRVGKLEPTKIAYYRVTITPTAVSGNISSVDTGTNIITWSTTHGRTSGQVVVPDGGTWPTGVTLNAPYYIRAVTTTTFSLHTTQAGAVNDTDIVDLSAAGSDTRTMKRWATSNQFRYGFVTPGSVCGLVGQTDIALEFNFETPVKFGSSSVQAVLKWSGLRNSTPATMPVGFPAFPTEQDAAFVRFGNANLVGTTGAATPTLAGTWANQGTTAFSVAIEVYAD